MTPAQRDDFACISLQGAFPDYKIIDFLTAAVENLKCKTIKYYDLEEEFDTRMKNALENAGFKIRCLENKRGSFIGLPKKESRFGNRNRIEVNRGASYAENVYVIAPGLIQEIATIHVVVSQKI